MPTSIAHALGGLAVAEGSSRARTWSRARLLVFCTVVANLPDTDFLAGLLVGDAGRFHRHATHTLLATLLVALACALWVRVHDRAAPRDAVRFGALAFSVYASHLVLDMLVAIPTVTSGVPLFWPIVGGRYYTVLHLPGPLAALLDIDVDKSQPFFHAVFSAQGALVFLSHALLFAPLPIAAWLIRRAWEWRPGAPRPERPHPGAPFAPAPEPAGED